MSIHSDAARLSKIYLHGIFSSLKQHNEEFVLILKIKQSEWDGEIPTSVTGDGRIITFKLIIDKYALEVFQVMQDSVSTTVSFDGITGVKGTINFDSIIAVVAKNVHGPLYTQMFEMQPTPPATKPGEYTFKSLMRK